MNYYFMTLMNLILGTLITISSSSWIMAWVGLELNLISFIPLMINKNNIFSSENTMKYFLIQSVTSSLFILISTISLFTLTIKYNNLLLFMIMAMKLAMAPLHFWLPPMVDSLSWLTLMILLTWQKIAPLSIIVNLQFISIPLIITSLLMGSMMMINQTSLKKLLTFSSINHLAWIMSPLLLNINYSLMYFLLYLMSSFTLMTIFNYYNINKLIHIFPLPKNSIIMLLINMLSIGGFPPLVMFFPKLLIIMNMIHLNFLFTLFLILSSLISLFSYLRFLWPLMLSPVNFSKMHNFFAFKSLLLMNFISIPLILPLPMLMLL